MGSVLTAGRWRLGQDPGLRRRRCKARGQRQRELTLEGEEGEGLGQRAAHVEGGDMLVPLGQRGERPRQVIGARPGLDLWHNMSQRRSTRGEECFVRLRNGEVVERCARSW